MISQDYFKHNLFIRKKLIKFFTSLTPFILVNIITIIFCIVLPYFLFEGRLYIGGDDTRLIYSYPLEHIKNMSFFSWSNISSLPFYNPNQYYIPFSIFLLFLEAIFKSKIIISYFAFSLPMILGLIYFQKLFNEITKNKHFIVSYTGSLFYILSPILLINQLAVFLSSVFLIGFFPLFSYYFVKYLKTEKFSYVFICMLWSVLFSLSLYAIPWVLGLLVSIFLPMLILLVVSSKKEIKYFFKKSFIFISLIVLSQSFWLFPFISTFTGTGNSNLGSRLLSEEVKSSFARTVLDTASGNIIYPLSNLFHRQIAFDYNWQLKEIFLYFYDKLLIFNIIFPLVLFIGLYFYKNYLRSSEKKVFIFLFISFLMSLFLFTVNIGPLREFFVWFGNIPGFVMFRNFYDKFAMGYVFLYALIITFCLLIIRRKFKDYYKFINLLILTIIIINFFPAHQIINAPLWTTNNIYRNVGLSREYLSLIEFIKTNIQPTSNVLSFPFNIASYAIINENKSNNYYIGTSPVKILSGVNDLSGSFSFPLGASKEISNLILKRDYKGLNRFLQKYNINYILYTKNIPEQIKKSYLFEKESLIKQDKDLVEAITKERIYISLNGNYEIYSTRATSSLFNSKNLSFQKVNPTKYKLVVKNLKSKQDLVFLESYHSGWKLYLVANSRYDMGVEQKFFEKNELFAPFRRPVFEENHNEYGSYGNKWILDSSLIKSKFNKSFYRQNKDGSIDLEMIMYFRPQLYFYLGVVMTLITLTTSIIFLLRNSEKK